MLKDSTEHLKELNKDRGSLDKQRNSILNQNASTQHPALKDRYRDAVRVTEGRAFDESKPISDEIIQGVNQTHVRGLNSRIDKIDGEIQGILDARGTLIGLMDSRMQIVTSSNTLLAEAGRAVTAGDADGASNSIRQLTTQMQNVQDDANLSGAAKDALTARLQAGLDQLVSVGLPPPPAGAPAAGNTYYRRLTSISSRTCGRSSR
jgi:hypothetical protein